MARKRSEEAASEAVEEKGVQLDESTPSGAALAEVGPPPEDASDEELVEHADRYAEAKRKARWGPGSEETGPLVLTGLGYPPR